MDNIRILTWTHFFGITGKEILTRIYAIGRYHRRVLRIGHADFDAC